MTAKPRPTAFHHRLPAGSRIIGISLLSLSLATANANEPALVPGADVPPGLGLEGSSAPPRTERLEWRKLPLRITLPVNRERLVSFPVPIRIGFPPELAATALRTQIVQGTIYWTALQPFAAQRIQVQAIGSGNLYLIDLAAAEDVADATPIEVIIPEGEPHSRPAGGTASAPTTNGEAPAPKLPPQADYVTLTRVAAQHLYAPERLLRLPEGVYTAGVSAERTDTLLHGGKVVAQPIRAWRSGNLHITAVKLRNTTSEDLVLDPRSLRGTWLACTFQHVKLWPKGDPRDTTAAYLISAQPFREAFHHGW